MYVNVYCILYTVYCILYTLYSILYTSYSILYTLYSILYTLYSIFYTLYCIQYTVYVYYRYNLPVASQRRMSSYKSLGPLDLSAAFSSSGWTAARALSDRRSKQNRWESYALQMPRQKSGSPTQRDYANIYVHVFVYHIHIYIHICNMYLHYIYIYIYIVIELCRFGSITACLGTGTAAHGGSSGALSSAQQTNCDVICTYNGIQSLIYNVYQGLNP